MPTTIDWPSSLPQVFQQDSFSQNEQSGVLITETSTGYKKRRKRFTAVSDFQSGTMIMTDDEYTILRDFIKNTVAQGALSFNFPNQLTLDPASNLVESRFIMDTDGPPVTAVPNNDTRDWDISFGVEVLP